MKLKKLVSITMGISAGIIILSTGRSQAALQANQATHNAPLKQGNAWITAIRNMEATGETMGLTETIDTATKLATSESNNIDVHMMKATEYGAVAILSASGYGNSEKLQQSSIKSTTGNITGVYFTGDRWEWTASFRDPSTVGNTVNKRYYDLYSADANQVKAGDAFGNVGCSTWHDSKNSTWFANSYYGSVMAGGMWRGGAGLFSYYGYYRRSATTWLGAAWISEDGARLEETNQCSRGVAVVGSGL